MSDTSDVKLRFHLQNVDPSASSETVQRLFDEALAAASKDAGGIQAKAEFEGGLFGVGETVIVLWLFHALKVGSAAFATGAAGAAGKEFYGKYLSPQLQKRNLLPSKLEEIEPHKNEEPPAKK